MNRWALVAVLMVSVLGLLAVDESFGPQEVSFAPGVSFSGAPSYVSEMATRFRDNGGPLSPFGSHFGLKAEVRGLGLAGVEHYACTTGRNIYDYSRTGLVGASWVSLVKDGEPALEARERRVRFDYFGWEEEADFDGFSALARVQFVGLDQYSISVKVINGSEGPLRLTPVLNFSRSARYLSIPAKADPREVTMKFAVQPITTLGENYLALISAGKKLDPDGKGFRLEGEPVSAGPGEQKWVSYVFGYSPDGAMAALSLAREGRDKFGDADLAWSRMERMKDEFFAALPAPHVPAGNDAYRELHRMAAVALENALYAPRGGMVYWGCVPTKVHYNWFWLWDSGFEALGYSNYSPAMARETTLSIFQAQEPDGYIAHMMDEREKGLTPHSQPPVFGYAAGKIIDRYPDDPATLEFERVMYDKGAKFLGWWEKKRDVNRDGLFEYISQDEGGWDNSPRMEYVPNGIFINYYGSLGELIGAKVAPLDNTDANAWIYAYYRSMERWARDLGRPAEESARWKARALTLAARVDEVLWDEEAGCWLDAYQRPGSAEYRHYRVLTPHIWFPAFTGATRDEVKARRVIKEHLLNPDEFFGTYPIPTVAYNDPAFDVTTNGWTAHIWLITAYSALEALWRFGYEDEAALLRERLLAMMANQGGMKGIYETYDPLTGLYKGEHSTGGYSSAQFGWSAAFTLEMILDRYQEERFVFSHTKSISGHIRRAETFDGRDDFYSIKCGREVPRVELWCDWAPLLRARSVKVKLSDPYGSLKERTFEVTIAGSRFELELDREYEIGTE